LNTVKSLKLNVADAYAPIDEIYFLHSLRL